MPAAVPVAVVHKGKLAPEGGGDAAAAVAVGVVPVRQAEDVPVFVGQVADTRELTVCTQFAGDAVAGYLVFGGSVGAFDVYELRPEQRIVQRVGFGLAGYQHKQVAEFRSRRIDEFGQGERVGRLLAGLNHGVEHLCIRSAGAVGAVIAVILVDCDKGPLCEGELGIAVKLGVEI